MLPAAPTTTVVRPQRTLKGPAEYRGTGLHSGKEIRVRLLPAEPGHGVTFVRTDLEDQPEVRSIFRRIASTCSRWQRSSMTSERSACRIRS